MRISFHLDEQVNPAIARELRRRNIDVTTTVEANLRGQSDESQLACASREGRMLVTHDDDFLRLASVNKEHSGIAYCHQESRSLGEIITTLVLIHKVYDSEEMMGRVEYL
ncbi:DUF5615 family PIN-like protein [Okeania sp. SIO3B5]|uniref:DUF5615 family PIN-like protein n=1 Tax=Okeania sp. SIO3B5 TaxID=2607811 RepID=UPI0025DC949E|nr:DUF5615 family PIN-like protein [Okeania sp. SIO3B5]